MSNILRALKDMNTTNLCRYCGRTILFRRWVDHHITGRRIYGNPVLAFHPDGLPCGGPGGQQFLNF